MLYIDNRSLLPKQTATPRIQTIILNYRNQASTQYLQKTVNPFKIIIYINAIQTKPNPKMKSSPQNLIED